MDYKEKLWLRARHIALERDNKQCVECGVSSQLHIHHIIPRHLGGSDDPSNLITLCAGCHAVRHPTLQVSLSRSFIERWAFLLARIFDTEHEIPEDSSKIASALRILGKNNFREGQMEIVLAALKGQSVLAVRPTGSGKTLCFQVPALLRKGTSYVFSPLKTLMIDQVSELQKIKIPGSFINSDISIEEKAARYKLLEKNALKLLYITPERFDRDRIRNTDEIDLLKQINPTYLIVDEAHCVDKWGDDFRPSYGQLADVRKSLGSPPVLAFTATAGHKSQQRILSGLGIPDARIFVSGVDRANISYIRHSPRSDDERYLITRKLIKESNGRTMIFVPTLRVGQEVKQGLIKYGVEVPFYHSRLDKIEREFLFGRYTGRLQPELKIIICTNAFGMGLDVPDVRIVIHWVQPESVEDYLQEFGRAGRDGKPSIAVIFKSPNDIKLRRFMAEKSLKAQAQENNRRSEILLRKYENIDDLDRMLTNKRTCFRQQIIRYFQDGNRPRRRSIGMMILEWLLSSHRKVEKAHFCCDACNTERARNLISV